MKKIFASVVALSAFAGPAMAADLYTPMPVAYDWSGAYFGGHLGYLWGDAKMSQQGGIYELPAEPFELELQEVSLAYPIMMGGASGDFDGLIGGIVGGWNFQSGNWVFGVEGDFGWTGADGNLDPNVDFTDVALLRQPVMESGPEVEMNWNAHIRGRAGMTLGEDGRTLLFVAGGLAIADADVKFGKMESFGGTFTGWSIGGGVNHAFDSNFIAGLEVLYDDYGSKTYDVMCNSPCQTYKVDLDAVTIRGTLTYHFN